MHSVETRLKKLEARHGSGIRVEIILEGETEKQARQRVNTDDKNVVFISRVDAEL